MAGTPVTQDDPIPLRSCQSRKLCVYLEVLERERRGLLKVGTILRAAPQARLAQEAAELQRTQAEQRSVDAQVSLDALEVSIAGQRARLDDLTAEVGEAEGRLRRMRPRGRRPARSSAVSASGGRRPRRGRARADAP